MCVCVCVCVREREKEGEGQREKEGDRERGGVHLEDRRVWEDNIKIDLHEVGRGHWFDPDRDGER